MKVNMQPPPEDPFCGGARRAETPRPVDIKRTEAFRPPPRTFTFPTEQPLAVTSTGASGCLDPSIRAQRLRARARRFSGARCNLGCPPPTDAGAGGQTQLKQQDETRGNDASTPVRSFGMLFRTIGITHDVRAPRTRASARVSNQRRVEMAACRSLSTTTDEIVFVVARARVGRRLPAPLRSHSPPVRLGLVIEETSCERDRPRLHLARFARPPSCSSESVPP